jgi:hypothetical protein
VTYSTPNRRTDVPWDRVPGPVVKVVEETAARLRGATPDDEVTRGKVSESYSVYRVVLYVRRSGAERPTHAVSVTCSYHGRDPHLVGRVRVGDRWV